MLKRFQYYSPEGKVWTDWFEVSGSAPKEEFQLRPHLLNEYKE